MAVTPESIFVPTVTLDGILTVGSFVVGGIVFLTKTTGKLTALIDRVEDHGKKIDKLAGIVEVQARHDERLMELSRRMNLMDQRWEEMRHGKGLVVSD